MLEVWPRLETRGLQTITGFSALITRLPLVSYRTFSFFQIQTSVCYLHTAGKYSLRHRKCGVRGYMHELFVSKARTSEVRASEGFWGKQPKFFFEQSDIYLSVICSMCFCFPDAIQTLHWLVVLVLPHVKTAVRHSHWLYRLFSHVKI